VVAGEESVLGWSLWERSGVDSALVSSHVSWGELDWGLSYSLESLHVLLCDWHLLGEDLDWGLDCVQGLEQLAVDLDWGLDCVQGLEQLGVDLDWGLDCSVDEVLDLWHNLVQGCVHLWYNLLLDLCVNLWYHLLAKGCVNLWYHLLWHNLVQGCVNLWYSLVEGCVCVNHWDLLGEVDILVVEVEDRCVVDVVFGDCGWVQRCC